MRPAEAPWPNPSGRDTIASARLPSCPIRPGSRPRAPPFDGRARPGRRPRWKDTALRLSLYTDLSLRLLLYLAALEAGAWTTTPAVARAFGVSLNHLQKVARGLAGAGYIEARQGRTGGLRLARPPAEVRLGTVVAEIEGLGCLVACETCPLAGRCLLKHVLDAAERSFVRELDRFTLADVLAGPTGTAVRDLIGRETEDPADPVP